ncbi:superfamily II DNA or RNA helicase [Microbacterium terrae]|uniref:RNA polymerase-associated protein RapA n=1 Tax=Microbacterium terrae TaxID=69369 RepID=A0A0M2H368_9MICO|nr:DEAD/DEAH box helicase [Microbacterium terrae]KJL37972.1 RNA polymerase-associated protein RapA [Microbacterium terrae]MBP1077381.1 superfamily II DNA or RNA helicase [Microbacterium terrae]GLJ98991.1 DNA helicase [Microbacterium terrae]
MTPPPFVDPAAIRRHVDAGTFERGAAYFAAGAVRQFTYDPQSGVVEAAVAGSGSAAYRCRVRLDPRRDDRPIAATSCTCPVQFDCKHTVAALLESNRRAAANPAREADASWRTVLAPRAAAGTAHTALALGFEVRQRVRRGASQWAPVRVETATARGLHRHGDDTLVGLRPLERSGRSDAWIKGDASWESVRRPGSVYAPAQVRWFAELHSIGRDMRTFGGFSDVSEWLTLDDIESSLLWGHLAAASSVGIALTATKRTQSVSIAAEASVSVRAVPHRGEVHVEPRVAIAGETVDAARVRPIGRSGLYQVTVRGEQLDLVLAPVGLDDTTAALLSAGGEITVPEEDADEFVRLHLPRIARSSTVEAPGLDVPPPERPAAVLRVIFQPGHRVQWVLQWRYADDTHPAWDSVPTPERDARAERDIRERVVTAWEQASPVPLSAHGSASGLDAAEFASKLLPLLEAEDDVEVEISGTRPAYRELAGDPRIAVTTVESPDPDWFELGVVVTIDGRRIPFASLFTALSLGRKRLLLSDGAHFSLMHPSLQRLKDLIGEAGELEEWETGPRLSRYQTDVWADFEDLAHEAQPAVSWRATVEGLRTAEGVPAAPAPVGLAAELRPYQRAGYDWLAFLWEHRLGGILADDMGLGKTLQMLALVSRTRDAGERRPFLVVAPTSVLPTWRDEAARFAPGLRVAVVDGTRAKRGRTVEDAAASADIVVTSYTLLRLDEPEFAAVEWAGLVLDEAQFVKNSRTKAYRAAKGLRADVVFAVTGTPLENSLSELWALLSLTAPGLFPSERRFREEYIGPIERGKVPENQEGSTFRAGRLARLRRRIRPLVLRRTKELVAPELPAKQEQHVHVELSAAHRALYDTVLQRERQKVLGLLDDLDRNRFIVFRSLTLLRLLSLAPELVDPAHASIAPSKLGALFERLDEVVAEGHRVLVFSQFTSFLALVAARLDERRVPYAYLDGSTRDREGAIESFRAGDAPVFLISLKAGGFGLTLTEADYVFLLDPWWNPAAEAQAVDRAHRIGQERTVIVYRLIAAGTIEDKVMALQQRKARLFRSVMDDDALFGQALTADDIRGLFEA